ncbi:hypothetical protein AF332_12555 [Sporosarcina globispora]|uniref:Uncharacterized protein n=1 Tax=Sporosarcina globispora TaxID=1459 RepID=A0A0M0GCL1_SPOGL|nr:hypothetical protein [Sporosarcina globispora]KON87579.1 hypothetical protein AF332_12555 [Sporosarcina globispora]
MDIGHYYRKTADISLNASLAALIPPFFFLLFLINKSPGTNLILILFPFIIYSFLCHQMYLLNKQRAAEIVERRFNNKGKAFLSLLCPSNVLIAFMPAPSLRMVIFDPEGRQIGEIRDMKMWKFRWFLPYFLDFFFPKRIGIYDHNDNLEASILIHKKGIQISCANDSCNETIIYKKDGSNLVYENGCIRYSIPKTFFYTDFQVLDEKSKRIARLRKGWMPLEWGKQFKDPNTPILSFNESLTAKDKLRVYAIFAALFLYRNH